jgi:5-methylcytosine-specific restriction protein A
MALRDITREAVLASVDEHDRLGQEEFLGKYGYDRARSYLLVQDGKVYDSKAIVGVAHGFLPGQRALTAREFSGGEATVGRLLRSLGFTVEVGDITAARLAELLSKLDVYRSDGLPALYQPITLLWAISRANRGEPRMASWEETVTSVGDLMGRYGRPRERPNLHYPVAALCGAGLWQLDAGSEAVPNAHGSSVPQRWFDERQPRGGLVKAVYELVRSSVEARTAAVRTLVDTYFIGVDPGALLDELGLSESLVSVAEMTFSARVAEYKRLCDRADMFWAGKTGARVERTSADLIRADDARKAVMLRSEGRCENPSCSGDVRDVTDKGEPILEVDHVQDLAKGGADNPVQMIALCPNCHAIKTRGKKREQLRGELIIVAGRRHDALMARTPRPAS